MTKTIVLKLGVLMAVFLFSFAGSFQTAKVNHFEKMGVALPKMVKNAPDFTLKDIWGKDVRLEDFKGKSVLLNFWATWCEACKEELPSMQRLHESLRPKGVEVVAISIDRRNLDRIKEYAKKYNLTFTILWDPDQKVRKNYYIMGLPTSYLIDAKGMLRGFVSGARVWDSPSSKEMMLSLGETEGSQKASGPDKISMVSLKGPVIPKK